MEIKRLTESIDHAKEWLVSSGIQNLDSRLLEVKGGFNCWYDVDKENYFYTYAEISGYSISILLFLHVLENKNLYLLRSVLAAEWLLDKASHESGGIKTRYYFDRTNAPARYDFSGEVLHSFDNGIALSGLIDLYSRTKEERYVKTGKQIGDLLVGIMRHPEGGLHASYSHKEKSVKDSGEKWSTQAGSYHAKVAIGLLKLFAATKSEKYKKAAIDVCNFALRFQKPSGRFVSYRKEEDTHLHPHCYSAEGLLYAGLRLRDDRYLKSALRATQWALDTQLPHGGILPSLYVNEKSVEQERSDVLAQTLRLGVIARTLGFLDKGYEENLENLAERLLSFQYKSNDRRLDGGFLFGHDVDYRDNLKSAQKNHLNSWCTMFALQSLIFYKDHLEKRFILDGNTLI